MCLLVSLQFKSSAGHWPQALGPGGSLGNPDFKGNWLPTHRGRGRGQEEQILKVAPFSKRPIGAEGQGRRPVLRAGEREEAARHSGSSHRTYVSLYPEHPPPTDRFTVRYKKQLLLLQKAQ